MNLTYEKGRFTNAATRGNGLVGENVTPNIRSVRAVPLELHGNSHKVPDLIEVRGEVFLTHAEFKRINEVNEQAGSPTFANPRNAAAGSVRQKDPKITASRRLDAFFYAQGMCDGCGFQSQLELLETYREWGLKTNPNVRGCNGVEEGLRFTDEGRTRKEQ